MNGKIATYLRRWATSTGQNYKVAKKLWKNTPRHLRPKLKQVFTNDFPTT